jgi:hypothetical protein
MIISGNQLVAWPSIVRVTVPLALLSMGINDTRPISGGAEVDDAPGGKEDSINVASLPGPFTMLSLPATNRASHGLELYSLVGTAVIAGAICGSVLHAAATPLAASVVNRPNVVVTSVKKVGYWRRLYRRGYAPYVYYPPAYGYYAPPPAYGYYPPPPAYNYYPPAYGEHVPPSADNGYSEPPPEDGYEEPPPESGS